MRKEVNLGITFENIWYANLKDHYTLYKDEAIYILNRLINEGVKGDVNFEIEGGINRMIESNTRDIIDRFSERDNLGVDLLILLKANRARIEKMLIAVNEIERCSITIWAEYKDYDEIQLKVYINDSYESNILNLNLHCSSEEQASVGVEFSLIVAYLVSLVADNIYRRMPKPNYNS